MYFRRQDDRRLVSFRIDELEYASRIERVRTTLEERKLDALYMTNGVSMYYLTGYSFISTERPAALLLPSDGKITFLGPLLEKDHIPLKTKLIQEIKTYIDYPGEKHPIDCFSEFLTEMKLNNKRIGTDSMSGTAGMWGYTGPALPSKLPDAKFVDASDIVWTMRLTKSEAEVELIRESSKWANLAHSVAGICF